MPLDETDVLSNSELTALEWVTLEYYIHQVNPENGLVADKTATGSPASIAAVGMALATAPFVVERGPVPRDEVGQAGADPAAVLPRQPAGAGARTPPATRGSTTTSST